MLVHAAIAQECWPAKDSALNDYLVGADNGRRFRVANWQRLAPEFAAAAPDFHDFEDVALAFETMESENERLNKGDTEFNARDLERVRDRAFWPALRYLDDLQHGAILKARRWWKTRDERRDDAGAE